MILLFIPCMKINWKINRQKKGPLKYKSPRLVNGGNLVISPLPPIAAVSTVISASKLT